MLQRSTVRNVTEKQLTYKLTCSTVKIVMYIPYSVSSIVKAEVTALLVCYCVSLPGVALKRVPLLRPKTVDGEASESVF